LSGFAFRFSCCTRLWLVTKSLPFCILCRGTKSLSFCILCNVTKSLSFCILCHGTKSLSFCILCNVTKSLSFCILCHGTKSLSFCILCHGTKSLSFCILCQGTKSLSSVFFRTLVISDYTSLFPLFLLDDPSVRWSRKFSFGVSRLCSTDLTSSICASSFPFRWRYGSQFLISLKSASIPRTKTVSYAVSLRRCCRSLL
jgi:hypothetical protein